MYMTRTQWFDCDNPPVKIGIYERRWHHTNLPKGHWDGDKFLKPDGEPFGIQDCEWRGLANKP